MDSCLPYTQFTIEIYYRLHFAPESSLNLLIANTIRMTTLSPLAGEHIRFI